MRADSILSLPSTLTVLTGFLLTQSAFSLPFNQLPLNLLSKADAFDRSNNIAVYWGQNSYGSATGSRIQERLAHYCANSSIDIIPLAFLTQIPNVQGEQPILNFANQEAGCSLFPGTQLLNCPQIADDIKTCQQVYKKKILLSIGGSTFQGGFSSSEQAISAARLLVNTFGPVTTYAPATTRSPFNNGTQHNSTTTHDHAKHNSTTLHGHANWNNTQNLNFTIGIPLPPSRRSTTSLRPFQDAVVDGFDLDFESSVQFAVPFAKALRSLMDADASKQFYLTAAPQCPMPDSTNGKLLNGDVHFDAVFVQFYNNACGLQSFSPGATKQFDFNFDEWNQWGRKKGTKIFLGVPAGPTAAGGGYATVSELGPIIQYSQRFSNFGGVMMWDASQAFANQGFLPGVRDVLDFTAHSKRMYRTLNR